MEECTTDAMIARFNVAGVTATKRGVVDTGNGAFALCGVSECGVSECGKGFLFVGGKVVLRE